MLYLITCEINLAERYTSYTSYTLKTQVGCSPDICSICIQQDSIVAIYILEKKNLSVSIHAVFYDMNFKTIHSYTYVVSDDVNTPGTEIFVTIHYLKKSELYAHIVYTCSDCVDVLAVGNSITVCTFCFVLQCYTW